MINIEIIDPVACRIERQYAKSIAPAISFQKSYWLDTPRGRREKTYMYTLWLSKNKDFFYFLTGHLSQVLTYCRSHDISIKIHGERPKIPEFRQPQLPGITFRPDQVDAIETALKKRRGIIKLVTRGGKTIIAYGICSALSQGNFLFLADKTDLVQQLAEEGRRFGFNVHIIGGGYRDLSWDKNQGNVVVMTRSSAAKLFQQRENHWMGDFFDGVFCDEVHHVSSVEGQYAKILKAVRAPLRLGLTATMPTSAEALSCITGFIGPVIHNLDINRAIEKDILIKPTIKLLKAPKVKIATNTRYDDVYRLGIVENEGRHALVAKTVKEFVEKGLSVLILLTQIDHGIFQKDAIESIMPRTITPFLHGETPADEREKTKKDLIDKRILCVISTVIWREGLNLPSLDCCILAGGGLSEIPVLQTAGRSLTRIKGKETAYIIDIFDESHHFLIRHFGNRLCLYFENEWL